MTTYRDSCGTHMGMRLHQDHHEDPCGKCLTNEAVRRLYRELVPTRPSPVPRPAHDEPITAEQAYMHARDLLEAVNAPKLRSVS